jgi:hypothetical protein
MIIFSKIERIEEGAFVTDFNLIISTSAEVKKMWIYTFTPPYAFMA